MSEPLVGIVVGSESDRERMQPALDELESRGIAHEFEVRSAVWLPVYLIGLGVIVYISDFGPLKNPIIPLWWDTAVVAAFSVAIYEWATRIALPRGKIEALVQQGAAVS